MMPDRSPIPSPFESWKRARVDLVDHRAPPPVPVRRQRLVLVDQHLLDDHGLQPPLDRAGQQAAHEVALQREEHEQRHDDRVTKAEAVRISQLPPREPSRFTSRPVSTSLSSCGAEEHQRDEQVVPDPEELEDREGGERREAERQHDLDEDLEVGGAVDLARISMMSRGRPTM